MRRDSVNDRETGSVWMTFLCRGPRRRPSHLRPQGAHVGERPSSRATASRPRCPSGPCLIFLLWPGCPCSPRTCPPCSHPKPALFSGAASCVWVPSSSLLLQQTSVLSFSPSLLPFPPQLCHLVFAFPEAATKFRAVRFSPFKIGLSVRFES